MSLQTYLPSAKFAVMAGAIALSGGLVVAAQYVTNPAPSTAGLSAEAQAAQAAQSANWQQVLRDIESQSGIKAPEAPSTDTVNALLTAAQSTNLTTQVGRTLLVSLSNANAQGLGSDIPTQEQLIAEATAQLDAQASGPAYAVGDLQITVQSSASVRAYGNAIMKALNAHGGASAQNTYLAIGAITDSQNAAAIAELKTIGAAYRALAEAIAETPVPQTYSPLHLQLANDFAAIAASYPDMQTMLDDPLRGLAGVQRYSALIDEARRVLTNIAQLLSKDGILFSKDEPGAAWSGLLAT